MKDTGTRITWVSNLKTLLIAWKFSIQPLTLSLCLITVKGKHALSAQHMSKSYGEVQASIRDTIIFAKEGYLGPNSPLQGVADTQVLIFKSSDLGPWFLTPNWRKIQRHNWPMGKLRLLKGQRRCFWKHWKRWVWHSNCNKVTQKTSRLHKE